ncbi:hypothetical protein BAUCODRAFT_31116 [Baudoinia panamericana UAMH 10762]|uniref:Uncharacterized protein n=1 Tax=Baudoinia panamericana (strain UAMH 10762) TaxID=717646 RepID=M2MQ01_BAUPA|nr:uncharacterized protein BAUCODRAFT_31116 [Baudoinia panamericana UAMH 10762]EMC98851.1 hypothetical protein BAUCODRAFT_31116 [Baudoinia panamericana UAMH 10762]
MSHTQGVRDRGIPAEPALHSQPYYRVMQVGFGLRSTISVGEPSQRGRRVMELCLQLTTSLQDATTPSGSS